MTTQEYLEVWGDTVTRSHLAGAMLIGAIVSLGAYFVTHAILREHVAQPEMAKAYAMLAGIAGCLVAGAICAVLFKPKRVVMESVGDPASRRAVLAQLAADTGGLGRLDALHPDVLAEMRALGLDTLFRDAETAPPGISGHAPMSLAGATSGRGGYGE